MLVIGIVLIVVGALLVWNKTRLEKKILSIKYFDRIDLKTALENYKHIASELGKGSFSQMVKLSAKAHSDTPLKGEFSGEDCVYYTSQVIHKYKKLEEKKDKDGKIVKNWVTRTEVVGDTTRGDDFQLNDGTGMVDINIQGADITPNEVVDDFKPANSSGGGLSFSFGSLTFRNESTLKTIGYSEVEHNIGIGTSLFVIGEINDRNGSLMISRPADKENPFIVSVKSEASILKGLEGNVKMSLYGGIAAAAVGVVLIIVSFFQ